MTAFSAICRLELRQRFLRVSTYLYAGVLFTLGLLLVLAAGGAFSDAVVEYGTGGKVVVNSPYSLTMSLALVSHFGIFITAALAGRATYDDVEHRCEALFFTAPISRGAYLGGRFVATLITLMFVYAAIALGAFVAVHTPWVEQVRFGPDRVMSYVQPYLVVIGPNLLLTASLFFSLAALTRRMLPVYVGAVVLMIGYLVAGRLTRDLENRTLAALLDPFALAAVSRLTAYWTVVERNTRLVPLAGVLLANRLIWGGLGVATLAFTFLRFRRGHFLGGGRSVVEEKAAASGPLPVVPRDFSSRAFLPIFASLFKVQLRETVRSVLFGVIVLCAVAFIAFSLSSVDRIYGTVTWPVTYQVLELVDSGAFMLVLVIVIVYSGELVWRERDTSFALVFDALPLPRGTVFLAKLAVLLVIPVLLSVALALCGIACQALKGYYNFEIGLYLKDVFLVRLLQMWHLCALAIAIQVLVNQKYVAHFVMVLYFVVSVALPLFGLTHFLYRFPNTPDVSYSDMNGYGHFVHPMVAFAVYWTFFAAALLLVASSFWVRGLETRWASRWRRAKETATRGFVTGLGLLLAGFVLSGSYIFYNTNVLNHYHRPRTLERRSADYEKRFSGRKAEPIPHITRIAVDVDLFPAERRAEVSGVFTLVNEESVPIGEIFMRYPASTKLRRCELEGWVLSEEIADLGIRIYKLTRPLQPGETRQLHFELTRHEVGFPNDGSDMRVVHNGTFVDSEFLPAIGYSEQAELGDDTARRKYGLQPKARMPDLDDVAARRRNYLDRSADWVELESTISTSADQLALAPGHLVKEWQTPDGRRHFHYKVEGKAIAFYAWASARYAVLRDRWNDVALEIAYHPPHTYNLDRMLRGMKASLEYCTKNFGPYQHRELRILEFPRYAQFAQAFPGTVPFSESIGFIARVDATQKDAIDYPFYVTAHEVGHQWWAHQVIGAQVQGATALSETLAQYTALMVMKQAYGPAAMRRFLRYELDRYLFGRGQERKKELPLMRVEDQQYIHYAKGSLVMYALQDAAGEAAVNRALADLVKTFGGKGPPYPTSRDLYDRLKKEIAPEHHRLLSDLFEHITLYELRAKKATSRKRPDGKLDVEVVAEVKKLRGSELGEETEAVLQDRIDVGALDEDDAAIAITPQLVTRAGEQTFHFVCDKAPAKAGIDPLNKLIDRKPADNVVSVEHQ